MGRKLLLGGAILLLANSSYLAAFATPSLFYAANVLLHVGLGFLFVVLLVWWLRREGQFGLLLVTGLAGALGLFLSVAGATRPHNWALWAHVAAGVLAMALLAGYLRRRSYNVALAAALIFPLAAAAYHWRYPDPWARIHNSSPPTSMDGEGDGPNGPFFPSSAQTVSGGKIPSNFFMESEACKRCHTDIYNQWYSSVHHFASFNNQFYRKSVEYMQEVTGGPRPSKWCAGCHDHALLFNGMFDRPIGETVNTPEAQAGLGCMSCHAVVQVKDSMGNGGFRIEYPPLHDLANSKNLVVRALHDFLTYADPEPHRRTFLKPFMRKQAPEFCSACHKVHLDVPVNSYRWIRGFNEYDNWQASGVSGQGARSFYYPKEAQTCTGCHMPLVKSGDAGNINGHVHSHRFPAANTAVPFANQDAEQLRVTEEFLKNGILSVDIFGLVPQAPEAPERGVTGRAEGGPKLATTFAVGEEAMAMGGGVVRPAAPVLAPLDTAQPLVRPGDTVRVEVVVRTRKIGHFFPGGTVDAFDVWVELEAQDEQGRTIFHSGYVEDGGRGPVEPGAHFYRSLLLDKHGNPIDKRNAFAARSVLYTRLIPPGAADTIHYRLQIPKDAGNLVRLKAKVNYRKFSWYYTRFAYTGVSGAGDFTPHYDDRPLSFTGDTSRVSGNLKQIPKLPIVTIAEASAVLRVGQASTPVQISHYKGSSEDRERWNDYGIGLLLQGDLKAAEAAFRKVTELDPGYADGWLNVARCLVQEGETEAAKPWIEKALGIDSRLARAHFFKALALKADGNYDGALAELAMVLAQYPRDRVALNQAARVYFLKRDYRRAVEAGQKVLEVDPEDLQAHYTLMLSYRGLGDQQRAAHEEKLYLRFKAEESSQTITGDYRRVHPEDNNERQMIHEHASVKLPGA